MDWPYFLHASKSPVKATPLAIEMPAQAVLAPKDKGKAPMNPSKKPKGNPLNTTSCEWFTPYNQGVEIKRRTKNRHVEIQDIISSQPRLEGGAAPERRSKRKQEQPVLPQATALAAPASSSFSSSSSFLIMV